MKTAQIEPRPLLIKNDFIGQNIKLQGFVGEVGSLNLTSQ